jgi:2-oxoglutarate/2-oxoacid ferredoxin oxidoreductase subunit beta
VLQPCVTFNRLNTHAWYRERVYKLDGTSHDPADKSMAYARAAEWGDRIPLGVIYKKEKPTYEDLTGLNAVPPLVEQPIEEISLRPVLPEFL